MQGKGKFKWDVKTTENYDAIDVLGHEVKDKAKDYGACYDGHWVKN